MTDLYTDLTTAASGTDEPRRYTLLELQRHIEAFATDVEVIRRLNPQVQSQNGVINLRAEIVTAHMLGDFIDTRISEEFEQESQILVINEIHRDGSTGEIGSVYLDSDPEGNGRVGASVQTGTGNFEGKLVFAITDPNSFEADAEMISAYLKGLIRNFSKQSYGQEFFKSGYEQMAARNIPRAVFAEAAFAR